MNPERVLVPAERVTPHVYRLLENALTSEGDRPGDFWYDGALTRAEMRAKLVRLIEEAPVVEASFDEEPEGELDAFLDELFGPDCGGEDEKFDALEAALDTYLFAPTCKRTTEPCPDCGEESGG